VGGLGENNVVIVTQDMPLWLITLLLLTALFNLLKRPYYGRNVILMFQRVRFIENNTLIYAWCIYDDNDTNCGMLRYL
jgi:hypothetical protein